MFAFLNIEFSRWSNFTVEEYNMYKNTILKFNSPKSVRPIEWLALAVLSFVYFSSAGRAQAWLDENF